MTLRRLPKAPMKMTSRHRASVASFHGEDFQNLTMRWVGVACRGLQIFALLFFCALLPARAQQTFTTFQPASVVVGQPSFTSTDNTSSQTVTAGPTSVAVSVTGKMAVGGEDGNR